MVGAELPLGVMRRMEALRARGVELKETADYVALIEGAKLPKLPPGCDSLEQWQKQASQLTVLVDGASAQRA